MSTQDGPQGLENEEMTMILSNSPVLGSISSIEPLVGGELDGSHRSHAVGDKPSRGYEWETTGYGFGMGMSTLAELNAFANDPFTVPLSALVNDYGLEHLQREGHSTAVSRTSSAISRPLAIGTSATAKDARWSAEPSSPVPFVSSPCSSVGSSTNQRGIRIVTGLPSANGKAVERRPPLASLDSACSYDSYTTGFNTPATSFPGDDEERSVRDRKGKGRATTQVAALVDSPPFSPSIGNEAPIPCTSVASTSSMPVGLLSNMTSTSPDGLGHYSPDVADLLRIPPFELERKEFDWNEFKRSLGHNNDDPSSSSASTAAKQAEPFVPVVTGLGLDLTPSNSRLYGPQELIRQRPQSLYFPSHELTSPTTIVQAPRPTHMTLQNTGSTTAVTRSTNRRHTISLYDPAASLAAQRYVLPPNRRVQPNAVEGGDSEPGTSSRHRPHSISIDTNGDRSSSIRSLPYSANQSPKLRKQKFSSWIKGKSPTISRTSSIGPSSPSTTTRQVEETKDASSRPRKLYKEKGRAQSVPSPFPYTVTRESILHTDTLAISPTLEESDVVAQVITPAVEEPIVSLFDTVLPRETKLWILAQLVVLHQEDFEKRLQKGVWSTAHANSERWVGKEAGMRNLIKLSRVSKSWLSLALDGQLWQSFDLTSFPGLSSSLLLKIAQCAGSFVQTLNLRGHSQIKPSSLLALSSALCSVSNPTGGLIALDRPLTTTQLTTINLVGCSALTTQSLRFLLFRSPGVQHLHLRGLDCVTNSTLIDDIGPHCHMLVTLDIRRCTHVRGIALASFAIRCLDRMIATNRSSPLKNLKASGLRGFNTEVLRLLGRAFPLLQVLDLSYCRDVSDDGFAAFVEWPALSGPPSVFQSPMEIPEEERWTLFHKSVELTSREAGLDPADPSKHWRRVTSLRHLNVSGCRRVSDKMCTAIAHGVPQLEFLEMAAVSSEVKDDGLLRLFKTTSKIRKIDLEDAADITDAVLDCLVPTPRTPPDNETVATKDEEPQPGEMLEHLVISYAGLISPAAMGRVVKGCKRLRVLEADNTRITGSVIRDFVSRRRHREKGLLLSETSGNPMEQPGSEIIAIDCRGVSEECIRDVQAYTRPRRGWRGWEARELGYEDQRSVGVMDPLTGDVCGSLIGQDECDPHRVVVKSFHGWVSVDAVAEQRTKLKRGSGMPGKGDIPRWLTHWSLGRRAGLGSNAGTPEEREDRGCVVQ